MKQIVNIASFWRNNRWKYQISADHVRSHFNMTWEELRAQIEAEVDEIEKMKPDPKTLVRVLDIVHQKLNKDRRLETDVNPIKLIAMIQWLTNNGHHPNDEWNGVLYFHVQMR